MINIIVWGTGKLAKRLMSASPLNLINVMAFVDNNFEGYRLFCNKPVISPKEALKVNYDAVVIASSSHHEILRQALDLGFELKEIFASSYIHFLPYKQNLSDEQFESLSRVPFWYHEFEVLPGILTPGICRYKPELLRHSMLNDLSGKSCLDIGAWDGPYSLELSRRGATVTALDIQPPAHSGFDVMRRLNELEIEHVCDSVYNLSPRAHGMFDLVTFFGVYYHLRNPLAAFIAINSVLSQGGLVLVEGAILEGAHLIDPYWEAEKERIHHTKHLPIAAFVKDCYQGEWSNWWVPTTVCLQHWMESSGFEILETSKNSVETRVSCIARKNSNVSQEHRVL